MKSGSMDCTLPMAGRTLSLLAQRAPDFDPSDYANLDKIKAVLARTGHDEAFAAKQIDIAYSILRERKVRCREFSMFADDEFEDNAIFVVLRIAAEMDQALDLSDALYRRLDTDIEDWNPAHLSIAFEATA